MPDKRPVRVLLAAAALLAAGAGPVLGQGQVHGGNVLGREPGAALGPPYELPIAGFVAAVANNTELKARSGKPGDSVTRLGFGTPGDGGLALYRWSDGNCPSPDDGAQVQPGVAGCWTADFAGVLAQIQVWGGMADDGVDDAPAIVAATKYLNGRQLYFPRGGYHLCTEVASTVPVSILGDGSGAGPGTVNPITKFEICGANNNGFNITTRSPSRFEGFWITSTVPQAPGYAGIKIQSADGYAARTSFRDVAFGSASYNGGPTLYDAVRMVEPNYPDFDRIYCQGWQDSCLNFTTTSTNEGSGGFIHHSYFFGNPYNGSQGPAIYSEVGYTFIHHNQLLAGTNTVHFCIKNYSAGDIDISHNTIENSHLRGVFIESCDGKAANMVHITDNEFANYDFAANMVAHIQLGEYLPGGGGVKWLKNVTVNGNILRSNLPAGAKYIWLGAGGNMVVANNVIEDLGTNNPFGVQVTGSATNNSLAQPILVRDNMIGGTTNRLAGNAAAPPVFVDLSGAFTVGTLPPYAAGGSTIAVGDGNPATNPCTGGNITGGALAIFQQSQWKCF